MQGNSIWQIKNTFQRHTLARSRAHIQRLWPDAILDANNTSNRLWDKSKLGCLNDNASHLNHCVTTAPCK